MTAVFNFAWRNFWSLLVTGLVVVILLNLSVTFLSYSRIVSDEAELESAEAVMVLGAGVYQSGELTPVLEARVDRALAIYRAGLAEKILVSGDNSTPSYNTPSYNEVVPVKVYLLAEGVPESDIFLDYAGFDTYDSMYRARDVFEVDTLIVVTQSFHLPRAVFIARALGLEVYGIAPVDDSAT